MRNKLPVLLLVICTSAFGQFDRVLSVEELREDYRIYRGTLEDFHAGLYWYTSKEELDQHFQEADKSLRKPRTEREFFRLLSSLSTKIRCGHTFIIPADGQAEKIWKNSLFPVQLSIQDGRLYCIRHYAENGLAPGDELLLINGASASELLQLMFDHFPIANDGYATTGKIRMIERNFHTFYAILKGQPETFTIQYRSNGKLLTKEIDGKTEEEIEKFAGADTSSEDEAYMQLEFVDSLSTALLTVRSFGNGPINGKKTKFRSVLEESMVKVEEKGVQNLILDLRGNSGGTDEYGLELFSYFHPEPIVEFEKQEFTINKSDYFKYSDLSAFKLRMLKAFSKTKKVNDSTYLLLSQKTLKPFGPTQPQFKGALYVLIDGGTFSTAADVAALFKSYQRGTLIGEETGGGYYGNTSGLGVTSVLPNSKFIMVTPVMRYTTNVEKVQEVGRGVSPDHPVHPTINELIDDVDAELNYALQLIGNK